ncbi:ComF family protein [Mycoavidus sp. SF9855]|uniref:ComF family protein n=1 Tax=Mycoavidus sp. SF9855 TaxID=2968475 RepID=UPI00211C672D|nr:ComF family protein [Mycoavidus sp. SF9855]UUM21425.1 ComF family protein [Mycoavidus sp. SF9855]
MSPTAICDGCDNAYWQTKHSRCTRCALPLERNPTHPNHNPSLLCHHCIATPPTFDATLTLAHYAAPLDQLVLALKFNAQLTIAAIFAERLASLVQQTYANSMLAWPSLIVPVPLSACRLATRGYNQAWEIARPLAQLLRIPKQATWVRRVIDTPPQAQLSHLQERRRNLRCAFVAAMNARQLASVRGQHIAVVDDVMTSGTTLEAVARILKNAGAARVTNLVALRTP